MQIKTCSALCIYLCIKCCSIRDTLTPKANASFKNKLTEIKEPASSFCQTISCSGLKRVRIVGYSESLIGSLEELSVCFFMKGRINVKCLLSSCLFNALVAPGPALFDLLLNTLAPHHYPHFASGVHRLFPKSLFTTAWRYLQTNYG